MKKRSNQPKQFGRRPILMRRWDGGLRIIYPNGQVEYANQDETFESVARHYIPPCTCRPSQRQAFKAARSYDYDCSRYIQTNLSAFLGYL